MRLFILILSIPLFFALGATLAEVGAEEWVALITAVAAGFVTAVLYGALAARKS